jgi:Bacterial Ig-like domain
MGQLSRENLKTIGLCGALYDSSLPATVRYNAETRTTVLDPSAPLQSNTEYTAIVEVTGDMMAVKDRGGTPMARDYSFSFTTGSVGFNC